MRIRLACVVTLASFCLTAAAGAADVTAARIIDADKEPHNWLSNGRTYSEQRFSPLKQINTTNVDELGLAWSLDLKSRTARGLEATPLVVDGVMYTTRRVEPRVRDRCAQRQAAVGVRPEGAGRACGARLLRRRQPRRRGVGRQGVRRHL